jgi:hypothetical protein
MKTSFSSVLYFSTALLVAAMTAGCTGVPQSADVNPEFREKMKGKTIGQATGDHGLWGQTEDSVGKKIVSGKTTKEEVRAVFGPCLKVQLSDSGETWTYESEVITIFSGSSYTRNKLVILFDDKGIVKRYSMNVDGCSRPMRPTRMSILPGSPRRR